jgi:chemotaxis receptor (MCP) glutamine deamidase CheD
MGAPARQIEIDPDTFHVATEHMLLGAQLREALVVCVNDDTQGVGGVLHLRHAADAARGVDLTDNTLSMNLLLIERFMQQLRSQGARNAAMRATLVAHIPKGSPVAVPAATLVDLIVAYYADAKVALVRREVRHVPAVSVLYEPREGRLFLSGATDAAAAPGRNHRQR